MNLEMVTEIASGAVAVLITAGIIVLTILGKPLDGLEAGFLAVIGLYLGGKSVQSAASAQSAHTRDTIKAVLANPNPPAEPPPVAGPGA